MCLSGNSSFNAVGNPSTGEIIDLTHYYGAWVMPYDERVQERIRAAADLLASKQLWGYQGDPTGVPQQVKALFDSLRAQGMTYVNYVIDYGAAEGSYSQRTRLPRESLRLKSANCIDGTVLMASLLEGASLNPAIVLVSGHAFVAWETWSGSNQWQFLETTLMGTSTFEDAGQSAEAQYTTCTNAEQQNPPPNDRSSASIHLPRCGDGASGPWLDADLRDRRTTRRQWHGAVGYDILQRAS